MALVSTTTSPSSASAIVSASSTAYSSSSERMPSTPARSVVLSSENVRSAEASGTCFTRTTIFMAGCRPPVGIMAAATHLHGSDGRVTASLPSLGRRDGGGVDHAESGHVVAAAIPWLERVTSRSGREVVTYWREDARLASAPVR